MTRSYLPVLAVVFSACVTKIPAPEGLGSFHVELVNIDTFAKTTACEGVPDTGTAACPRPFPELAVPVSVTLFVTAINKDGTINNEFQGAALVDVRPGRLEGVGPGGLTATFVGGRANVTAQVVHSFGVARVWVEECGSSAQAGSFATGVSPALYFDEPTVSQLNATIDNTSSPLEPRATNVCAIGGDPRYGIGTDQDGNVAFVGYSQGRAVNAPPPAMGNYVEIVGCSRDAYNKAAQQGTSCARGPLVVTGIGNEGFYVTDLNPAAISTGFNHLYSFNFNYPDDLVVGDIITSLRGSPVEFAGSTQIGNPSWTRDDLGYSPDLLPKPVKLEPAIYREALRTYGRNEAENLDMEKLEGAVVCVDNVAPASRQVLCDANESGGIERQGCLLDSATAPLPPLCSEGMGSAPRAPSCTPQTVRPTCLPMTAEELSACGLQGYVPDNPFEYCCERSCYNDLTCTEQSSFVGFGQWTGDVYGRYEPDDSEPVKIAVVSRDANPDFDSFAFATEQLALPEAERKRVRVIGNLRQVLAARPVWLIVARSPSDIEIGGTCPE